MASGRKVGLGVSILKVLLLWSAGASLRSFTIPKEVSEAQAAGLPRRQTVSVSLGVLLGEVTAPRRTTAAAETPRALKVAGSSKAMPAIGYGTCCRPGARGEELVEGVKAYLAAGGRLIDTAQIYGNHEDIAEAIQQSAVDREELWVTSKVRVQSCNTAEDVVKAVDTSLQQLDIGYLDLMLLHGGDGWGISSERDEQLWRGLIAAQKEGKVRSIGVSNHNREEVERLIEKTKVVPVVNQLEFHPWVPSETKDLVRWCQQKGIVVTAYGSLGGSRNKAQGEVVSKVAELYGKTNAQVLLRWALDQGVAVIPGTNSAEHIREDLDLNFRLDPKDVQFIESSNAPEYFTRWRNCRSGCA